MQNNLLWKIAGPSIVVSAILLALGFCGALYTYSQQRKTTELMVTEIHSMVAVEDLNLAMREIRYLLNMYLRTREPKHLLTISAIHSQSDLLLQRAGDLATGINEQKSLKRVLLGYSAFFQRFSPLIEPAAGVDLDQRLKTLEFLADDFLTREVVEPLQYCIKEHTQVVEQANRLSRQTASRLGASFLLLGVCVSLGGVFSGIAVARAVGRSIVQLNVSVQSVASRLSDIKGPVSFTHFGGTTGIDESIRALETRIEEVIQAFQEKESELLRSEQLATVGQMAAGLAHELRNPLMPMKMLVQAALKRKQTAIESKVESSKSDSLQGHLRTDQLVILNDEILRLEQTIQSFLDFARPNLPRCETVDIVEVLHNAIDFMRPQFDELRIGIELKTPSFSVLASVDKNQIRQLFLNLLRNSIDALPGGGRLRIALTVSDKIVIVFHDDGPGIPDELTEKIFEPFVTTKETGTGLGLSISKQIATAHGGELIAKNNCGAVFVLEIPRKVI